MRYRFEKASQVVPVKDDDIVILPLKEAYPGTWAEIPSIIYPEDEDKLCFDGITDVVCENIGAIQIAKEHGLRAHGGVFLNVLNSSALDIYGSLGLKDCTISMELSFSEMRKIDSKTPYGIIVYGYLPLMKFRNCPGDCATCKGQSYLKDRLGESFPLICRDKKYSELLNCVPLYVGDKLVPKCSFQECYFTTESQDEIRHIIDLIDNAAPADFRRTAGLYQRELL